MGAAGLVCCVEFFAGKTPGVDTAWDTICTFIRIPVGAVGDVNPALELTALPVGGGTTAGTHASGAGTRILLNTSPEPVTNRAASVTEDVLIIAGIWAALHHPRVFIAGFAVFVLLLMWLLPKMGEGIRRIATSIKHFFNGAMAADGNKDIQSSFPESNR